MEKTITLAPQKDRIQKLKELSRRKRLIMVGKTTGYVAAHGLLGTLAGATLIKLGHPEASRELAALAFWASAFSSILINPMRSISNFANAQTSLYNARQKLSELMEKPFKPQKSPAGIKINLFGAALVTACASAGIGCFLGAPYIQKIIPWAAPKTQKSQKAETNQTTPTSFYHSNISSFS